MTNRNAQGHFQEGNTIDNSQPFADDDIAAKIRAKTTQGDFIIDKMIAMLKRRGKNKLCVKDEKDILIWLAERGWGKAGVAKPDNNSGKAKIKIGGAKPNGSRS